MEAKNELTKVIKERYIKASKKEKGKILDEYYENTGYNRKYAIYKIRRYIPPSPLKTQKEKASETTNL